MAKFLKVAEPRVESNDVVLVVRRSDDGVPVGRIVTMAVTHAGVTPTTTDEDPPIGEAIRLASKLAEERHVAVSVVDPDSLWEPKWGTLD